LEEDLFLVCWYSFCRYWTDADIAAVVMVFAVAVLLVETEDPLRWWWCCDFLLPLLIWALDRLLAKIPGMMSRFFLGVLTFRVNLKWAECCGTMGGSFGKSGKSSDSSWVHLSRSTKVEKEADIKISFLDLKPFVAVMF
jgi:hypothetical protein